MKFGKGDNYTFILVSAGVGASNDIPLVTGYCSICNAALGTFGDSNYRAYRLTDSGFACLSCSTSLQELDTHRTWEAFNSWAPYQMR